MTIAAVKPTQFKFEYPINPKHAVAIKAWVDAVTAALDAGTGVVGALAATVGGRAVMATGYFDAAKALDAFAALAIVGASIANNTLTGGKVAVSAAGNTIPAVPVEYIIAIPDGTTGNVDTTVDATVGKFTVTNVRVLKNASAGGVSDTIQVSNGTVSTPISDAMSINVAANIVVAAGTILSANAVVSSAAVLRVTRTKASAANVGCTVIVTGYKTA
jgi:uncharacterized membrane protein